LEEYEGALRGLAEHEVKLRSERMMVEIA